ncbi:SWIM zinc finger family protein [Cohnella abietis]|uniref:SWIM-type domain-containing protein n=1 Tax=Cohnella abietis TaxID=2507935 RepID=A0A3T1CZV8_9BACL|nr:SWIM zinc finger family protein [Cohnella abietis]BBI31358.1 hypothetical protein KCTCHS21_07570 [Cohnella abietis]
MTPNYEIDDDQWNMLVQDVADNFEDVTLNRGFQYFKQAHVLKLTMPSNRSIEAIVEGSENYHVSIDLDFFTTSRCDCPVKGFCKHMFAALLKYADLHNRSIHTLVNAKSVTAPQPSAKPVSHAMSYSKAKKIEASNAAKEAAEIKEQASQMKSMSVHEWHELFERCTARLSQRSQNIQFSQDALKAIYKIKPELPPVLDLFFSLHARLFILSELSKLPQDQSGYMYSYLAYHAHHAASDIQETVEKLIESIIIPAAEPDNASLVAQTIIHLRKKMLVEKNDKHYFLYNYLGAWTLWMSPTLDNEDLCSTELKQLAQEAQELGSTLSSITYSIAQSGMHLYQGHDDVAKSLLNKAQEKNNIPEDSIIFFLVHLSQNEQWERLTNWLIEVAPLFTVRRSPSILVYAGYWDLAAQHLPRAEQQMWETLASMLPHSRAIYEEKLLINEKWERWIDYHLTMNSDPLDFRVAELQPLEKNAPEVLLPFYHQAIEKYVLLKNRDAYKSAVKMLKRLAKLYKKMKQEQRWELFFDSFLSRNSRLRALQEELRKGKLLQ